MRKPRQILNWIKVYRRKLFPLALGMVVILIPITYLAIKQAKTVEAAKLKLSTTSSSITIDVDDRYKAVMNTGATEDYLTFYDREEDNGNPDATQEIIGPRFKDGSAAGDPFVKSVEYVEISLTGTTASANLTKGQTIGDSVPFASQKASATNDLWDATLVDLYFEAGPKITATRSTATGTVTIGVFVVEFDTTKVNVQQGTITSFTGTSSTETITSVTTAKAAMVFYYENQGALDDWDHSSVAGWFSNSTTLSFQRDASDGTINGHYYVFEAQNTEFSVQSGTFAVTGTSNTATITSVTTNKSFVIASYRASVTNDDAEDGAAIVTLQNATTVSATRYGSSNALSDIRYFVVEFAGSETVQRGTFSYTGAGSQATATITQVNTNAAMAWNVITKPGTMRNSSTSGGDVDEGWQQVTLANSTTVQGDRAATGTTAQGAWEVIEFSLADGTHELRSDPSRTTTILEATDTRVKIRVEGCLYDAGVCLDDGTNDITVKEEYVFTPEGMFVNQTTDWQTSGKALPSASIDDGYSFAYIEVDSVDAAYDDAQNIYYGDGSTEASTSIDGAFEDTNKYVTLLGHGTGSYQSAIVGISQNGWFDQTGGTDDWYWDENVSTTVDRLFTREQGTTPTGSHNAQWYIQLHQKADLDSESEREGFYNDYANPDILSFTTGSAWQEVGTDEWNENEGAYTIDMSSFHTEFDIDGGTYTRYSPVFKIRDYRNTNPPSNITLEGVSLKRDINYNAEIKPFSDADFYDSSAASYTQLAVGGNTGSSDEYLATADNNYTITFDTSDYLYLGSDSKFTAVNIGLATNGSGSLPDVAWQYCSANTDEDTACDTWSSLSVTDQDPGANDFTASGTFYFSEPVTWPGATVNSSTSLYYIRGYLSSGSYSTNPIENTIKTDIVTLQYTSDIPSNSQTLIIPNWTSGDPSVAYWNFDEGYGSTAYDSAENSNDLSITNATWEEESVCLEGKCLHYDGTGDYVTRPDDPEFDFAASRSFTITGWIRRPPTSSLDTIVAKYEATGADGGYKIYMESDGDLVFGIDDDNTWGPDDTAGSSGASYDDNEWHHFAAVKNGITSISMYIDGSLIQTNSSTVADNTLENNDAFYIGIDGDGSSNGWDGFIDEVKVYRYARSADEVKSDYIKGASVKGASAVFGRGGKDYLSEGLVGYWKMDETTANTCDATNDSCDSSGNDNDGAWQADATSAAGKFGNGVTFDGIGDYTQISDNDSFSFGNSSSDSPFSVSTWINMNDATSFRVINKWISTGSNDAEWVFGTNPSDQLQLAVYDNNNNNYRLRKSTSNITSYENQWAHILATYDGRGGSSAYDGIKLYINGSEITDTTDVSSGSYTAMENLSIPVNIGALTGISSYANGTIDDARIYNRTLSPSEVEDLYNWATEPVGYWKMDDNSGTTIYDSSTNENNLTLNVGSTSTIAHEQTETGISTSSTTVATTSANLTAVNNHLYLAAVSAKSNKTVNSVAGLGLTWTEIKAQCASDSQTGISVWYALGSPTADGAVTATLSAAANNAIAVSRYSGINPNNPYGNNHTANINGVDTADCTNIDDGNPTVDITTTIANAWAYGAIARRNNPATPGTGYTERVDFDSGLGGGSDAGIQIEDKLVSTASTLAVDATISATDWAIFGAELRPSLANEPGWSAGKYGGSMKFDGDDDYVSVSDPTGGEFDFGTGSFTLEAWIKHGTTSAQEGIISKYETTGVDGGYVLRMESDGDLTFGVDDDNTTFPNDTVTSTAATYDDNKWHHVVGVKNGTTDIKLYIDGDLITTNSSTIEDSSISNNDTFYVGAEVNGTTNNWTGSIDDIRIYNYARTQQQIVQDMNAGHPAPGSPVGSPTGYWNFDEGYGSTTYDASSYSNNGTLGVGSSAPSWSNLGKIGKTLSFDGSNDYVDMGDQSEFDWERTQAMSLEAWIKTSTDGSMSIISKEDNGTSDRGYQIQFGATGKFFMQIINTYSTNGIEVRSTDDLNYSDGNWHHIVGTYDGSGDASGVKLYYDGRALATTTTFNNLNATILNNVGLRVGARTGSGAQHFNGEIDEAKIYNFVLTEDQVKITYNQGAAQVLGATSTESSGNPSWSSDRSYCPPGDTTSSCEPILHLKMDENTGTTAYDISTNANNGNLGVGASAPSWAPGKVGSGLSYDGADDYLVVTDDSTLQLTNFTLELWFYADQWSHTATPGLISKRDAYSTMDWELYYNVAASEIRFSVGESADAGVDTVFDTFNLNPSTNTWHHLAVTKSGTTYELYFNGRSLGTDTSTTTWTESEDIAIGSLQTTGSQPFDGMIDEVKIYNYARNSSQIAWDYNKGAPVGYWALDECTGTTAYDSSGNGNNGTIYPVTLGNTSVGTCSSGVSTEMWNNGTTGKRNASLDFDGTDDYITVSQDSSLEFGTNDFSVSFWFKTQSDAYGGMGYGDRFDSSGWTALIGPNGVAKFIIDDGTTQIITEDTTDWSDGTWHHYIATMDRSGSQTIYIDGKSVASNSISSVGNIDTNDHDDITIGRYWYQTAWSYYTGQIDEVKIFNYVLTQQQINNLVNEGAVMFE